jgi:hypothetical protein
MPRLLGCFVSFLAMAIFIHADGQGICFKSNATHIVGQKLSTRPVKIVQGVGSQLCARECEKLTVCLSFNYNLKSRDCELLDRKPDDSTPLVPNTDYVYGEPHNTVSTSSYNVQYML